MSVTKHLWTEEQTEILLVLYEKYPLLWDSKNVNSKNVKLKEEAYDQLAEELRKEIEVNISKEVLKIRIKSVRDYYRKEYYKVIKSSTNGGEANEIYVPTVSWYNTADRILREVTGTAAAGKKYNKPFTNSLVSIYEHF